VSGVRRGAAAASLRGLKRRGAAATSLRDLINQKSTPAGMGWISYASFLARPSSIHEILPHRFKGRISFVLLPHAYNINRCWRRVRQQRVLIPKESLHCKIPVCPKGAPGF